jgi:circadian clock protein KaiC
VAVGEPLEQFRGILMGSPEFEGKQTELLRDKAL